MEMPFGKYRGYELESLPFDYLTWLWENIQLREPLRTAISGALGLCEVVSGDLNRETVKRVYRNLALKYHPDHGGNNAAMIAITEFYERLME